MKTLINTSIERKDEYLEYLKNIYFMRSRHLKQVCWERGAICYSQ